jgi:hypothetical protein
MWRKVWRWLRVAWFQMWADERLDLELYYDSRKGSFIRWDGESHEQFKARVQRTKGI